MEKPKLLIGDPAEDFRNTLAQTLQGAYRVRTAGDGWQLMQLLHSFLPDVLILDLIMPGLDGITLLQKAAEQGICPKVLATTRYLSDYTLDAIEHLGVGYVMLKPCDISAVAARVMDLYHRLPEPVLSAPDSRVTISNTLLRLGISTKLRGYGYLREAVLLMSKHPDQSITKELYPSVASMCNVTSVQIERSIRSAIATAWEHSDQRIWQLYFSCDDRGLIPRPSNAAFISRLADSLLLESEFSPPE